MGWIDWHRHVFSYDLWSSMHEQIIVYCENICNRLWSRAYTRILHSSGYASQRSTGQSFSVCECSGHYNLEPDNNHSRGNEEGCECFCGFSSAQCPHGHRLLYALLVFSRIITTLRIYYSWFVVGSRFTILTLSSTLQVDLESLGYLIHVPFSSVLCLFGLLFRAIFSGILVSTQNLYKCYS